jgi:hypothetical protein
MDHFDPDDPGHRFFAGAINGLIYTAAVAFALFLGWRYCR